MRTTRVLGVVCVLFLCGCEQTKFDTLVNIPSKFEFINFQYNQRASLQITCWYGAYADNRGTDCAVVRGTIDWGDGFKEYKENIPPCVSVTNQWSWSSSPSLIHSYPAVGSYVIEAEFKVEFTNGAVTAKLRSEVTVTY